MRFWYCIKCKKPYHKLDTDSSGSRICPSCKNTKCADCGVDISNKRADAQRCNQCKDIYNLHRIKQNYLENEENKENKRIYDIVRRDVMPEVYRAAQKRWRNNNSGKKLADTVNYRLGKEQRTVSWANNKLIENYYIITAWLGYPFVVDHKIPLHGKFVSGLHVETNLQIITEADNLRKSNHFSLEHEGVK